MGRAFREQVTWLSRAWDGWSEAEQVVALYSVARKLSPIPTRFLQILLTYNFPLDDTDIFMTEARANDPAWVSHICETGDGTSDLLHHLPLLRPANGEAKAHYLTLIPKVLSHALSQGCSQPQALDKARQLLSYSLIHPALSMEERRSLTSWLKALEDKLNQASDSQYDPCSDSKDELGTTPLTGEPTLWNDSSGNQISQSQGKDECRWGGLEVPPSPNNSGASSRSSESESFSEDGSQAVAHPGMRDIGIWLKSLRLHKYSPLLSSLQYEELLALDEDALEAKGVTKGARHKIILSIAKLHERPTQMEAIEKDLMSGGSVNSALNQLKHLVLTPMMPSKVDLKPQPGSIMGPPTSQTQGSTPESSPDPLDLPSQFTRVMGKVCTHLLVCARPDDEAMSCFLNLVDRCNHHEAFSVAHCKRLSSWKQQILRIWHPPRNKDMRHVRRWSQQYTSDVFNRSARFAQHRHSNASSSQVAGLLAASGLGGACFHSHLTPPPNAYYNLQAPMGPLLAPRNSLPGVGGIGAGGLLSPQHFLAKRPSLQETPSQLRPHVTLQRTRSAPSRPHQLPLLNQPRTGSHLIPDRGQIQHSVGAVEPYSAWGPRENISMKKPLTTSTTEPPPGGGSVEGAETDLTNRLESLCLSMTEHALG